jgi:hypothetical protein
MYSRVLLMCAAFAASPAAASSIERLVTAPMTTSPSMQIIHCLECKDMPPATRRERADHDVASNGGATELRTRFGRKEVVRKGSWMGGSPVTFVSLSPVWISAEEMMMIGHAGTPAKGDGVDLSTTTSAVGPQDKPAATSATAADHPEVDFSTFELRPSH